MSRPPWGAIVVLAAAALIGVVVFPRLAGRPPVAQPTPGSRTASSTGIGATEAPTGRTKINDGETGTSSSGTKRADLADAARHLSFTPVLPQEVAGRGALLSIVTVSDKSGLPNTKGLDNALRATYADNLIVSERLYDPRFAHDQASFIALLTGVKGAGDGPVRSVGSGEATLATWASSPAHSAVTIAHVAWFANGVGYTLSSPTLAPERLLAVAETMLD